MKVKELRERLAIEEGSIPTGRLIAYVIDGLEEINMLAETHVTVDRITVTKDKRSYVFPSNAIKILDIRAKNHLNSKDEYRSIPRLIYEPLVHDADEGAVSTSTDTVEGDERIDNPL